MDDMLDAEDIRFLLKCVKVYGGLPEILQPAVVAKIESRPGYTSAYACLEGKLSVMLDILGDD